MSISAERNKWHGGKAWHTDPELFKKSVLRYKTWLREASGHIYAAQILLPYEEKQNKEMLENMSSGNSRVITPSLSGIYFFHCALSVENTFKALLTIQNQSELVKRLGEKNKIPRLLLGHNLVDLSGRAKRKIDIDEEFILAFLTRYSEWSGKYFLPVSHQDQIMTQKLSDGEHYLTGGYDPTSINGFVEYAKGLYVKIEKQCNSLEASE